MDGAIYFPTKKKPRIFRPSISPDFPTRFPRVSRISPPIFPQILIQCVQNQACLRRKTCTLPPDYAQSAQIRRACAAKLSRTILPLRFPPKCSKSGVPAAQNLHFTVRLRPKCSKSGAPAPLNFHFTSRVRPKQPKVL